VPPRPTATPYRTPTKTPAPAATPAVVPPVQQLPPIPPASSGPLTATQETIDLLGRSYYPQMLDKIGMNFTPPRVARGQYQCLARFRITREGFIKDPEIVKSSGRPELDSAAIRALLDTAKLPALYDDFKGGSYAEVTVIFQY
jgi:TonB family protein